LGVPITDGIALPVPTTPVVFLDEAYDRYDVLLLILVNDIPLFNDISPKLTISSNNPKLSPSPVAAAAVVSVDDDRDAASNKFLRNRTSRITPEECFIISSQIER
jgi:hypothetical protein